MAVDIGRDFSFSDISKAIHLSKKSLETRVQKSLNKIIGSKEEWAPSLIDEWIPFEEMRMKDLRYSIIRDDYLYLVWSPVEVWLRFQCPDASGYGKHIISLLTGESYYTIHDSKQIEADDSPSFPKKRASSGILGRRTVEEIYRKATDPISPLILKICET